MNNLTNKFGMRFFTFFSFLFVFSVYSDQINISVNGGTPVGCEYSVINFNDGNPAVLNIVGDAQGNTCTVTGNTGGGNTATYPTPQYPVSVVQDENNNPATKPYQYRWKKVDGATYYQVRVYTGTAAQNSGIKIYERNLNSQGSAAQVNSFNNFCSGTGPDCIIDGTIAYYNYNTGSQLGKDLADGNYHWQVRVVEGETTTSFSDATADFIIDAEVSTAATESPQEFDNAWVNQRYDPQTGANDFASKTQLISMLDTPPYNSYQEIAGNKKVYIVNNSFNSETIIPSCVNGKNGSLQNRDCTTDIPIELNDIFALRLKTRNIGISGVLNKASNQLYPYEGAFYKVVLSKYPGRMVANQADDFQGRCSTTSINLIGEFSLYTAVSGDASTYCIVPDDTQLYANVELLPDQTQCTSSPGPSGYVCQLDINLNGFATPNN